MSETLIDELQRRVNQVLPRYLPEPQALPPSVQLLQAMRYAVLSDGKRVRPVLVYAAAGALGSAPDAPGLDACACAVEFIHAYSLIHDDLPAMDDDDLRRGRPTCHRAFDEASAILAGDALQALALQTLAESELPAALRVQLIATLASAAGYAGMVGGQAIDLAAVGRGSELDLAALEVMHNYKTGALIVASLRLGALAAGADQTTRSGADALDKLDQYGRCIGLAFQIHDDVLDVTASTETLGKTSGADQALDKPTYPQLLGLDGAQSRASELCAQAQDIATGLGSNEAVDLLCWLAGYIIQRRH